MTTTDKPIRLDAYYYGFDATNCGPVDAILSAVAHAGRSFHNTEDWNDRVDGASPRDWIQTAALNAAAETEALRADLARERERAERSEAQLKRLIDREDRASVFWSALLIALDDISPSGDTPQKYALERIEKLKRAEATIDRLTAALSALFEEGVALRSAPFTNGDWKDGHASGFLECARKALLAAGPRSQALTEATDPQAGGAPPDVRYAVAKITRKAAPPIEVSEDEPYRETCGSPGCKVCEEAGGGR